MAGKEADFLTWAESKGVRVNGIELARRPGRGCVVLARRRLKKGQTILSVPIETIRSLHTVSDHVARRLPPHTSIHCLLALDIALDRSAEFATWKETMPKLLDFEVAQPFFWHENLQNLLPKPAKELLNKQQATFREHWCLVSAAFPQLRQEEYLHSWFLAGTRSFYYVTSEMEKYPIDDRLALMPVADLFNHAETGCDVSFTPDGYHVLADRVYRAGEEALKPSQAAELKDRGLLGPFLLDSGGVACRKTRSALEILCSKSERRQNTPVAQDEGGAHSAECDVLLDQLVRDFHGMAMKTLDDVHGLRVGQVRQREVLEQRWNQIVAMVAHPLDRPRNPPCGSVSPPAS
ncbi:SET domain-containing protein [Coniochaeta ligniaria NRRL 30616]|uniref:SET domain-containing protein n=1 Tax=Coniochaeta ligniaria NRRL 30616 TaxID=1408157 RepID=A0A1J7IN99_9PEZI|nr:SET domain-containing protein [Coniochaeta ligniaria NRRL 30616]